MDEIVTSDMSKFGARERKEAARLLMASVEQGFPEDFNDEGVTVAFNTNSGYVFLTNSDYQVAMMNGDKLESIYSCPQCGHEGFKEYMKHGEGVEGCEEFLKQIGVSYNG